MVVNVGYDLLIGVGFFAFIVYILPYLERKSLSTLVYKGKDGKPHQGYLHPKWFALYAWLAVMVLVVPLWNEFADLLFSTGWKNPFVMSDWFGIRVPGWLFDFAYARATDTPSGAHIISYIGVPLFGLIVTYKFARSGMWKLIGDPFQGLAAAVFMGGAHELVWIVFYYTAYWPYLNWSLAPEVVRDVSFVSMSILLVVTFWRMPTRKLPMRLFKWPIVALVGFCLVWFFVPHLFLGLPYLPITTINNPQFGIGVYQETPWFSSLVTNLFEVTSWLFLWVWFSVQAIRYKP